MLAKFRMLFLFVFVGGEVLVSNLPPVLSVCSHHSSPSPREALLATLPTPPFPPAQLIIWQKVKCRVLRVRTPPRAASLSPRKKIVLGIVQLFALPLPRDLVVEPARVVWIIFNLPPQFSVLGTRGPASLSFLFIVFSVIVWVCVLCELGWRFKVLSLLSCIPFNSEDAINMFFHVSKLVLGVIQLHYCRSY